MAFANTDYKSIFLSVTFWGAIISLLSILFPGVMAALGVTSDQSSQTVLVSHIISVVGVIITIVGRFKANQPVKLSWPKKGEPKKLVG